MRRRSLLCAFCNVRPAVTAGYTCSNCGAAAAAIMVRLLDRFRVEDQKPRE